MKKIIIIVLVLLVVSGMVYFTINQGNKDATAVQLGNVAKEDLSTVISASGEIRPKNYVNIGANAYGKIMKLYVKEGDRVHKGQLLAQIDNVQPEATVAAQRAAISGAEKDLAAAEADLNTNQANLNSAKADAERTKLDYERAEGLYKAQLIAKQDYDSKKAAYEVSKATVAQWASRIEQSKAQFGSVQGRISQAKANLVQMSDALSKTTYVAPYDGVVTNLPVREGESVVVGIQNATGSTLMTISDLSVITAEVKVDETDVINIKNGQNAEITIDAVPGKTFKGHVSDIGNNALLRTSGVATTQTTTGSQEAKDFKVVVTLDTPPDNLRPGLSCTAKITTASKTGVIAIPIQALTIRTRGDLEEKKPGASVTPAAQAAPTDPKVAASKKEELQGVFKVDKENGAMKVKFIEVKTGITGSTDIEITDGLKADDQIVIGSYKALRTLKNGSTVKKEDTATPASK
jgi:HlyD family secretion protein